MPQFTDGTNCPQSNHQIQIKKQLRTGYHAVPNLYLEVLQ